MKADDYNVDYKDFVGDLDPVWYQRGYDDYVNGVTDPKFPDGITKDQLLAYRQGSLYAARDLGDLEREDFYSEKEFNYRENVASQARPNR